MPKDDTPMVYFAGVVSGIVLCGLVFMICEVFFGG